MKKIVIGLAALACAASMFSADVAARVVMEGSLAGGDKNATYLWQLNKKDQKDADAAIISVSGDKAGANFQLWYNYAGDDAALKVRSTNLWFKPADMVKVTVGDVSSGAWFGNTLDYWKNPVGGSIAAYNSWGAKFSSYATVEGSGVMVEVTPVAGLTINGGITAGAGNKFVNIAKDATSVAKYGVGAMYAIADMPLTVGVTYRDDGKGADKLVSVGAKYGNPYGDPFHTSINARMRFENKELAGITVDNYFKYATGAVACYFRAPVTIRLNDDSYLDWSAKVTYAMDGFTPYLFIGSDIDNAGAYNFKDFGNTFEMQIQPGVTLNVGTCALDIAAKVNVGPTADHPISWALPFTASVSF